MSVGVCIYTCSSSTDAASIKPVDMSDVNRQIRGKMLSPSILDICVESTISDGGT